MVLVVLFRFIPSKLISSILVSVKKYAMEYTDNILHYVIFIIRKSALSNVKRCEDIEEELEDTRQRVP